MRKLLLISLVLAFSAGIATQTQASKYKLDNQAVDLLFESATSASFNLFDAVPENMPGVMAVAPMAGSTKDPAVAILLDFFLGGLGIHRFYLGTKTMTGIGYILTCGGIFGIVPLVDFIVLIINYNDISQFVDNPKFFMW
ncbi:MAG: TM2 domain-containing protein [Bacteroidales bacterium]|nr:TM2 domain-containing protein [Bacteroidales bacterium]